VVLARYVDEDLATVLDHLTLNAGLLAHLFERLSPDQLARTGVYGYPEPTERTMLWVGQHTVHELVHHLRDIHHPA
jgi:S-DNA-T family DNA segregation ATPase FtsK/SpoIIIE